MNLCNNDWIAKSSLANKRFKVNEILTSDWFNATTVMLIFVLLFLFRRSQLNIDNRCDILENTPSDYTLIVSNIPKINNPAKELKEYFEKEVYKGDNDELLPIKVCSVNLVYLMDEID